MKPDCTAITDLDVKKSVEARIIDEWDNGILQGYKKNYPNASVVVSLPNKNVDYWGDIFDENGDLIARFSIIGDKVIMSSMKITEI